MLQNNEDLLSVLVAPDDQSGLVMSGPCLAKSDGRTYPAIPGIPWLFEKPVPALLHWQAKVRLEQENLANRIREGKAKLPLPALNGKTRDRIRQIIKGQERNLKALSDLMGPLLQQEETGVAALEMLAGRSAAQQQLFAYENVVFRDWGWQGGEHDRNQAALAFMEDHIPASVEFGRTLVLGAGACRFPIDFARRYRPDMTIACDINPFLLLVARTILGGGTLEYYEIPAVPKDFASAAVRRKLRMTDENPDNFYLVLADALRPPFSSGSMDVVLTPWFVDIVNVDFAGLAGHLNGLLKEGGHWICWGPLHFNNRGIEGLYSLDEVKILAKKAGFEITTHAVTRQDYLSSPASALHRSDQVHCIVAKKIKSTSVALPEEAGKNVPEWILNPSQPIPRNQGIAAHLARHTLRQEILSLVDGARSIRELTPLLTDKYGLNKDQALTTLLGFFTELYEEEENQKFRSTG